MTQDPYRATASAYDLFAAPYRQAQLEALDVALPHFMPGAGPILDVGAGSGAASEHLLTHLPDARVVALEPSPAMRALILGRIARNPAWFPRITVRPESFFDAELPQRLGGAIALGVLGHFDAGGRRTLLAELAGRLPADTGFLIDLQAPEHPTRVEPYEFTAATVGDIEYRGVAEAWPVDAESMRWRMRYLTLHGDRVLSDETIEHLYHHPPAERFEAEARAAGFEPSHVADTFWLLTRAGTTQED